VISTHSNDNYAQQRGALYTYNGQIYVQTMAWYTGWGRAFGKEFTDPRTRWTPNATHEGAGLWPAGKGKESERERKREKFICQVNNNK